MNLLQELNAVFGLGSTDLLRIIRTAPQRYKVYQIEKRHGGMRTIAQPSRELKYIQRHLLQNFLPRFPVHEAATGYLHGINIRDNAKKHVGNRVILKLDFEDFFPSIRVRDWRQLLRRRESQISTEEKKYYDHIFFWGAGGRTPQCLSIGAPSSPALSNIIMFDIDEKLYQAAVKAGLIYTRYADDITVSGDTLEATLKFEKAARRIISKTKSPLLSFNEDKRGVYMKGQRRMVTGLVLTPQSRISIGRERKRLISAMIHQASKGELSEENQGKLKGLLGFAIANEADFLDRLRRKYGSGIVDRVLRFKIPPRAERE